MGQRLTSLVVLCGIVSTPAYAQEAVPTPHCSVFCKLWRNVSGHVDVPVAGTANWDNGLGHVPTAAEESRIPHAGDLVVVHGDLLQKSQAERKREKAEVGLMAKRIDALRDTAPQFGAVKSLTAKPVLGQND